MHTLLAVLTLAGAWTFAVAHQLIIYWVFAASVDNLPAPAPTSSGFYKWFFGVAQWAAANLKRGTMGVQGKLASKP